MRKIILIAHTSLDGFVAFENGSLSGFEPGEDNLGLVCNITEAADTALFGRVSYELLEGYWPGAENIPGASANTIKYGKWYNAAHKFVLSKTFQTAAKTNTTFIGENILGEIDQLKKQDGKNILLFGSPSVFQLLVAHNLVDEYWIFVNPVIFGKGIPLFKAMENKIKLKLIATVQFDNGEFALNYIVEK